MTNLIKRPIVIQDLIDHATYISADNLDAGDGFLYAAEQTFQQIAKFPGIGRLSGFTSPALANTDNMRSKDSDDTSSSIKFILAPSRSFECCMVPKILNLFLNRSNVQGEGDHVLDCRFWILAEGDNRVCHTPWRSH